MSEGVGIGSTVIGKLGSGLLGVGNGGWILTGGATAAKKVRCTYLAPVEVIEIEWSVPGVLIAVRGKALTHATESESSLRKIPVPVHRARAHLH